MNELRVDLPITEVTLFEDRARVQRSGTVELPAGTSLIRIPEVSPIISDRTLSAGFPENDEIGIGSLSIHRSLREIDDRSEEVTRILDEIEENTTNRTDLDDRCDRIDNETQSLISILDLASEEIPRDVAAGLQLTEMGFSGWEDMEERITSLALEQFDIETELKNLDTALEDLQSLLEARRTPSTGCEASLVIDVRSNRPGSFNFKVEYLVPGACWRPRHRALMMGGKTRFETDGCVWQNTGESWNKVQLNFSTHRPSLGNNPPLLDDDQITVVKKAREEVVEIQENAIEETGFGGESGGSSVSASLPGVDDGGIVRTFKAAGLSDVPSDGRPYRVNLESFKCDSESGLFVMPELSPYAFIRGLQTNNAEYPVLAGPVDLIRENGYIGKTVVMYVAPGEVFPLGWGPDPNIRTFRKELTKKRDAGVLNTWDWTEYSVELKISNIGPESRTMTIRERIPVSEIEKVRVKLDSEATTTSEGPDSDGIIEWTVSLEAFERRSLKLVYTIESRKGVVGV